jgi:hypothetical protein
LLGETHGRTHWKIALSTNNNASTKRSQPVALEISVLRQVVSPTHLEIALLQRVLIKPLF